MMHMPMPAQVHASASESAWEFDSAACAHQPPQTVPVHASKRHGELKLVVNMEAPFRVQAASHAFLEYMQLPGAMMIGRPLCVLQGPETNSMLLQSVFETVCFGKEASANLMLYTSSGVGQYFQVSAKPWGPAECHLRLEPLQVTRLKAAMLPDGCAKAIISSDFAHATYVSAEFERLYGYSLSEIKGRTLSCIHGPSTDTLQWRKLLDGARNGYLQSALVVTSTRNCREMLTSVLVEPVVDCGALAALAITFTAVGDIEGHCVHAAECQGVWGPEPIFDDVVVQSYDPDTDFDFIPQATSLVVREELYDLALRPHGGSMAKGSTTPATPATPAPMTRSNSRQDSPVQLHMDKLGEHAHCMPRTRSGSTQCSRSSTVACGCQDLSSVWPSIDASGDMTADGAEEGEQEWGDPELGSEAGKEDPKDFIVVMPRLKTRQEQREITNPVVLSMDVLRQLMSMPLCSAAATLGLSSTAMKKACRRLGVQRWPYNVHASRGTGAGGRGQYVPIDSAYVRRIQRKYSLMERKVAHGQAGASSLPRAVS